MLLSIIAAMDRNRLIGNQNRLPWHLPADLAHFKSVTMGKPIIMGRKTYESIGHPLPGRTNVVMTRSTDFQVNGVEVADSLAGAINRVGQCDEVMIIGGSTIYKLALPLADRLYLTIVENEYSGDAWFPAVDLSQWQIVNEEHLKADEKNPVDYRFTIYQRM